MILGRRRLVLDLREVFLVTDFLRSDKDMIAKLSEFLKPVISTEKEKHAAVIQNASSSQDMSDLLDRFRGYAKSVLSKEQ
jgi:hypothetical protein